MTEEEIKTNFITPALQSSEWDFSKNVRMEFCFTDGQINVIGNKTSRGKKKYTDYLLLYKSDFPIAIVEAKDNKHSLGSGMQQAIDYGCILDVPFVYSSNGDGFLEHDMKNGTEREISLDEFPTKEELWNRYKNNHQISEQQEKLITVPYYHEYQAIQPRYYQRIAINRTIQAIAEGKDRILLVMATGTGKTYTAFQIIYRLWKSQNKKKILYLADRNILIDQTMIGDFQPFDKVMTKIVKRKMDSSYEIYMALYHQLAGEDGSEPYREFKPDFFDLIVVDECHRGSARATSNWRKILNYFSSAAHIGMTATPKESNEISNTDYFGNPLYTYSLKQGIQDGFLAPYKVIRVGIDVDLLGYRPEKGKVDMYGEEIIDREYNTKDFDRTLIIDDRTKTVARKVTEYLKETDRYAKTIIFCVDIDHAERMRQALVNENSDLVAKNEKYIMRITGDTKEGKDQLDNFIDEESLYPTIVTTSKLLTTGVNCKTCKIIVLDNTFGDQGMTEFKQIIGRGTRIKEDYNKMFFTILDFRNASRLFADKDFDGEPVQIYEPGKDDPIVPPGDNPDVGTNGDGNDGKEGGDTGETGGDFGGEGDGNEIKKFRVNDVMVKVLNERVHILDENGKLIVESIKDFSKKNVLHQYATLTDFINAWNNQDKKEAIINELKDHGVLLDELRKDSGNKDLDEFDLICHLAYDKKPLTKAERINNVKKRDYLNKYSDIAQQVLQALMDKYMDNGITEIEELKVLELDEFRPIGSPMKIIKAFGGKHKYQEAIKELEKEIYAA